MISSGVFQSKNKFDDNSEFLSDKESKIIKAKDIEIEKLKHSLTLANFKLDRLEHTTNPRHFIWDIVLLASVINQEIRYQVRNFTPPLEKVIIAS